MRFDSVEQAQEDLKAYLEGETLEGKILEYYGVLPEECYLIKGKQLHDYMVSDDAIYSESEDCLVFVGNCDDRKFLYYMGAENEAELVAKFGEVTIYQGIDYERIARYL